MGWVKGSDRNFKGVAAEVLRADEGLLETDDDDVYYYIRWRKIMREKVGFDDEREGGFY